MEEKHTGVGAVRPLDAEETMEITLREEGGEIAEASFRCSGSETLTRCGETLCGLLPGHAVTDLFYTDNNVIYYNVDPPLARSELYLASVAVLAAKRAAADWCRKNGAPVPPDADGCHCITKSN